MTALKVGYHGQPGSYSHQACTSIFPEASHRSFRSFHEMIKATKNDEVDRCVIPVENSAAGRVMEVYNLLPESELNIVGEYLAPIHHCLIISRKAFRQNPPASIKQEDILAWKQSDLSADEIKTAMNSIREIQSHSQAIEQCRGFIEKNLAKADVKAVYDTATAVREMSAKDTAEVAAIGSRYAADMYDVAILRENIEDIQTNTTRFLVLSNEKMGEVNIEGPALTTFLFETGQKPGSLLKVLQVLDKHKINMTKLESYMCGPVRVNPMFYVDVGASVGEPRMKQALEEIKEFTLNIRILGSYAASPLRMQNNGFLSTM